VSANLYYSTIAKGTCFGGGSTLTELLREAKGEFPITFDHSDLAMLRGMALADKHSRKDITELIEAIEKHGALRVWAEW
jgi:hypothetical protein